MSSKLVCSLINTKLSPTARKLAEDGAKVIAVAQPMPPVAPVTIVTFPLSGGSIRKVPFPHELRRPMVRTAMPAGDRDAAALSLWFYITFSELR